MFQGVVSYVGKKAVGKGYLHSIGLQGQDGFHSLGFEPHSIQKGDSVSFEVKKNAKGYDEVDRDTLQKLASSAPVEGTPVAQVVSSGGGFKKAWSKGGFGKSPEEKGYWAAREARDVSVQKRIEVQSCRNSALALVEILLGPQVNAVELPKKVSEREQVVALMVKHYTDLFIKENSEDGNEIKEQVEEPVKEDTDEGWD